MSSKETPRYKNNMFSTDRSLEDARKWAQSLEERKKTSGNYTTIIIVIVVIVIIVIIIWIMVSGSKEEVAIEPEYVGPYTSPSGRYDRPNTSVSSDRRSAYSSGGSRSEAPVRYIDAVTNREVRLDDLRGSNVQFVETGSGGRRR